MRRHTGEVLMAATAALALSLGSTACGPRVNEKFSCDPNRVFNYGNGTDFGTRGIQARALALAVKDCSADAPNDQVSSSDPSELRLTLAKNDGTTFVYDVETTGVLGTGAPNTLSPKRIHTQIYRDEGKTHEYADMDMSLTPTGWVATRFEEGKAPIIVASNAISSTFRDVGQEAMYWLAEQARNPFHPEN